MLPVVDLVVGAVIRPKGLGLLIGVPWQSVEDNTQLSQGLPGREGGLVEGLETYFRDGGEHDDLLE